MPVVLRLQAHPAAHAQPIYGYGDDTSDELEDYYPQHAGNDDWCNAQLEQEQREFQEFRSYSRR